MKKLMLATAAIALGAGGAFAEDVKIGLSLGFTGPLESMSPNMAKAAEMAIEEANASGKFLNGSKVTAARADNTCADAAASVAAVERLARHGGAVPSGLSARWALRVPGTGPGSCGAGSPGPRT